MQQIEEIKVTTQLEESSQLSSLRQWKENIPKYTIQLQQLLQEDLAQISIIEHSEQNLKKLIQNLINANSEQEQRENLMNMCLWKIENQFNDQLTLANNLKKYLNSVFLKYCESIESSDEIFEKFQQKKSQIEEFFNQFNYYDLISECAVKNKKTSYEYKKMKLSDFFEAEEAKTIQQRIQQKVFDIWEVQSSKYPYLLENCTLQEIINNRIKRNFFKEKIIKCCDVIKNIKDANDANDISKLDLIDSAIKKFNQPMKNNNNQPNGELKSKKRQKTIREQETSSYQQVEDLNQNIEKKLIIKSSNPTPNKLQIPSNEMNGENNLSNSKKQTKPRTKKKKSQKKSTPIQTNQPTDNTLQPIDVLDQENQDQQVIQQQLQGPQQLNVAENQQQIDIQIIANNNNQIQQENNQKNQKQNTHNNKNPSKSKPIQTNTLLNYFQKNKQIKPEQINLNKMEIETINGVQNSNHPFDQEQQKIEVLNIDRLFRKSLEKQSFLMKQKFQSQEQQTKFQEVLQKLQNRDFQIKSQHPEYDHDNILRMIKKETFSVKLQRNKRKQKRKIYIQLFDSKISYKNQYFEKISKLISPKDFKIEDYQLIDYAIDSDEELEIQKNLQNDIDLSQSYSSDEGEDDEDKGKSQCSGLKIKPDNEFSVNEGIHSNSDIDLIINNKPIFFEKEQKNDEIGFTSYIKSPQNDLEYLQKRFGIIAIGKKNCFPIQIVSVQQKPKDPFDKNNYSLLKDLVKQVHGSFETKKEIMEKFQAFCHKNFTDDPLISKIGKSKIDSKITCIATKDNNKQGSSDQQNTQIQLQTVDLFNKPQPQQQQQQQPQFQQHQQLQFGEIQSSQNQQFNMIQNQLEKERCWRVHQSIFDLIELTQQEINQIWEEKQKQKEKELDIKIKEKQQQKQQKRQFKSDIKKQSQIQQQQQTFEKNKQIHQQQNLSLPLNQNQILKYLPNYKQQNQPLSQNNQQNVLQESEIQIILSDENSGNRLASNFNNNNNQVNIIEEEKKKDIETNSTKSKSTNSQNQN